MSRIYVPPKLQLPPPPPPPRKPISVPCWALIPVAAAALVCGVAVGTVIDVNQPAPSRPAK
jgi:hypothetical protein